MKYTFLLILTLALVSCSSEQEDTKVEKADKKTEKLDIPVDKADLIKIEGSKYTEFYPDGKSIKFEGLQDEDQKRHGKWVYFSKEGLELSMTMYEHGKKHGHSVVKYPNGTVYYYGEYEDDKKVGIWKTYNEDGTIKSEINYDEVKK